MICAICHKLSLEALCDKCLQNFSLSFDFNRFLDNNVRIICSYFYSEVRTFLASKNYTNGNRILDSLSKFAVKEFFKRYKILDSKNIAVIYIGHYRLGHFSHNAITARHFKKYGFKVIHNALNPSNDIKYAKLNLQERKLMRRDFTLKLDSKYKNVILIDDICTTKQTLKEASEVLLDDNRNIICAFVLADARF